MKQRVRANLQITADPVRLIDASSEQVGVVSLAEARQRAQTAGLDLVEVSPTAKPPVVRIVDWGKWRYEQDKHQQKTRRSQKQVDIKQIRLGIKTDTHDLEVKLKATMKFLEAGHKVRINVRYRGREITHPEIGRAVLDKFYQPLAENTVIEQQPAQSGRELSMVIRKKDAQTQDK